MRLVNGLANRVVHNLLTSLVRRHVDRVRASSRLVLRHIDRVVDGTSFCLVRRYVHGVVDRALVRFPDRLSDGVVDRSIVSLTHVVRDVDRLGVVNRFRHIAVRSELLRNHNRFANCSHYGCRSTTTDAGTNARTASHCSAAGKSAVGDYGSATSDCVTQNGSATATCSPAHSCHRRTHVVATAIASRTATSGMGQLTQQNGKHRDCWHSQSCFHLRNS